MLIFNDYDTGNCVEIFIIARANLKRSIFKYFLTYFWILIKILVPKRGIKGNVFNNQLISIKDKLFLSLIKFSLGLFENVTSVKFE